MTSPPGVSTRPRVGWDRCELCGRQVDEITRHHLIPRTRHKNKRNKRKFDREDVKTRTIDVCRPCHKNIHAVLSNKELERDYNTLDALKTQSDVRRFSEWVASKAPDTHIRVKSKKR